MASTNTSFKRVTPSRSCGGFTLVEASMGAAIGAIIMAGVLSTYIMTARQFHAISNYWEIHMDGRTAIDRFAVDMRAVYAIKSFAASGPLVVKTPYYSSGGWITNTATITYTYTSGMLQRTDALTGSTAVLATNVYNLKFSLFDRVGSNTTVIAAAKGVSIELFLRKSTAGKYQTEDYLSARMNMRNKP